MLRFTGAEILNETDMVVHTIGQAIERKARERSDQNKRQWLGLLMRRTVPIGGTFAAEMAAAVVLTILLEYFAPTLFFHLTGGL